MYWRLTLALCQRYYEAGLVIWRGATVTGLVNYGSTVQFKVTKRASATIVYSNFSTGGANFGGMVASTSNISSFDAYSAASVGGGAFYASDWAAPAEL